MGSLEKLSLGTFLSALIAACAAPGAKYPPVSTDGLQRVQSKRADAVYWKQGATLAGYDRVNLQACDVRFRKNWQRDQNYDRVANYSSRVTDEDMARIRAVLSDLFHEQFSAQLLQAGYQLTDDRDADVLMLKPTIMDLDITAPDVSRHQMGRQTTYVAEAGEMTLSLEFYDALNNDLIGRAIDRRVANPAGRVQISNSVTNLSEALRILESWSGALVDALDEARER